MKKWSRAEQFLHTQQNLPLDFGQLITNLNQIGFTHQLTAIKSLSITDRAHTVGYVTANTGLGMTDERECDI